MGADHETTSNATRRKMVAEDIMCRGIRDQRVLQVLATLPRHLFVPEDIRRFAYEDRRGRLASGRPFHNLTWLPG